MMKKTKVKQGTLEWEKLRERRIGSSEIFDIVRYYATDTELWNCGINAEDFRREKPFTSVWSLYHKMINSGFYKKAALGPEDALYGHAAEGYGVKVLSRARKKKLSPGEVYIDDYFIASLDIAGVAEEIDCVSFDYGTGTPKPGQKFVCEQKTVRPALLSHGIPYKYIIQAQYQILSTHKDFYILQIMVLDNDTAFERGRIYQMPPKKRYEYLDDNMTVAHYYFKNNPALARLIETAKERFINDVENLREPKAYIATDSQQNIIESIRENALFNAELTLPYDLEPYIKAKEKEDRAKMAREQELQRIITAAKENNACRFKSETATALFCKNGRFMVKEREAID